MGKYHVLSRLFFQMSVDSQKKHALCEMTTQSELKNKVKLASCWLKPRLAGLSNEPLVIESCRYTETLQY